MATSNQQPITERLYLLWIGCKVEQDYERRGVFPDLRGMHSTYSAPLGRHVKISRGLLKAITEDALEQRAIKRGREGRGLATSYGIMSKNLLRHFGMEAHVVAPRPAKELASVAMPEYCAGTARQPVTWNDCLWRPTA